MIVKELINHLQKFDRNLKVGTTDHFGHFEPIEKEDFYVRDVRGITIGKPENICYISCPYLGPEPD